MLPHQRHLAHATRNCYKPKPYPLMFNTGALCTRYALVVCILEPTYNTHRNLSYLRSRWW